MLTSLPTPPTDSLYKFSAFIGLMLVVTGIGTLLYVADHENRVLQAETNASYSSEIAHAFSGLMMQQANPKIPASTQQAYEALESYIKKANDYNAMYQDHRSDKAMFLRLRSACYVGLMLGSLLSVGGLYLWITKVQLPADRLLRYQLIEAQQRVAAAAATAAIPSTPAEKPTADASQAPT